MQPQTGSNISPNHHCQMQVPDDSAGAPGVGRRFTFVDIVVSRMRPCIIPEL